jgi:hypothetical protein
MSVEEGWRNRVKLFGVESLNALDRWRYENDKSEQARAQEREQRKRDQERREQDLARASAADQIVALRAELSAVRDAHESLCGTFADVTRATADVIQTLGDQCRDLSRECEELRDSVKTQAAKLVEPHGQHADFKFAREKSGGVEVADLPSFLPPRRTVN